MGKTSSCGGTILLGALCAAAVALAGTVLAASPEDANQAAPSNVPRFDPGGEEALPPLPTPQAPPPPGPPPKKKKGAPPPPAPIPEKGRVGPKRPFGEDLQVLDRIVFEAQVRDQPGRSEPLVLRDLRWTCTLTRCTAEGPRLRFGVEACAELARAVGPVSSFRGAGRALTKQELLQCNASVTTGAGGFGVAPGGGGFGPPRKATPQPPPSPAQLAALAETFRKRAAALPPSPYSDRCDDPFSGGLLGDYLGAAGKRNVEAARRDLVRIDRRLACVSAQRFAGLHDALGEALNADGLSADDAATLSPVVLLFAEFGGGDFRAEMLEWLRRNRAALIAALANPGSVPAEVGFLARYDGSRLLLDGPEADQVLTALDGSGLDSGRCTLLELLPVNDDDEGRSALFCPKDCRESVLNPDDEAQGRLAGTLPPEVQEQCKQMKEAKDKVRKERPGIAACIREFNATSSDMLACQTEGLASYRADRLHIDDPRERTREDIWARRRCFDSQDLTENQRRIYMQAVRDVGDAINRIKFWNERLQQLASEIKAFDRDFAPETRADLSQPATCDCDPRRWREWDPLLEAYNNADAILDRETQRYQDARRHLEVLYNQWLRGQGNEDCAPEAGGCSDTCGIQDALLGQMQGCIDHATAREAPQKKGGGSGPDPTRAMPDPRGGGYLPGSVSGLQECIRKATSGGGPQGDPACYDKTCPEGKVPKPDPDRPGRCLCQDPGQKSAAAICRNDGYIDCGEEQCTCLGLERKVSGALGEGAGGGTQPPGDGRPDPSPIEIPIPPS